eukprot:scaffold26_cov173-Pinguiococcus_pyrenoidosus.AAC.4
METIEQGADINKDARMLIERLKEKIAKAIDTANELRGLVEDRGQVFRVLRHKSITAQLQEAHKNFSKINEHVSSLQFHLSNKDQSKGSASKSSTSTAVGDEEKPLAAEIDEQSEDNPAQSKKHLEEVDISGQGNTGEMTPDGPIIDFNSQENQEALLSVHRAQMLQQIGYRILLFLASDESRRQRVYKAEAKKARSRSKRNKAMRFVRQANDRLRSGEEWSRRVLRQLERDLQQGFQGISDQLSKLRRQIEEERLSESEGLPGLSLAELARMSEVEDEEEGEEAPEDAEAEADFHSYRDATIALWIAAFTGQVGTVTSVLEDGDADLEFACPQPFEGLQNQEMVIGYEGATALVVACMKGHTEIVRKLLEAKANADATMPYGSTAIEIAKRNGHKGIVQLLESGTREPNM